MSSTRSFLGTLAAAGVALALAMGAGPAQARDVYWSVGVNSPGVAVGVSNGGYPVYVAPAPVYYPPPPRPVARVAHWVEPELVAQVAFAEWTSDGILRHPAYQGQREDKAAADVVRELPS